MGTLENITTWVISNDQNYLKMTSLSYLTDFHVSKCLSITKILVNAKLLVVGKLLVYGKLFPVGKHLVDAKY